MKYSNKIRICRLFILSYILIILSCSNDDLNCIPICLTEVIENIIKGNCSGGAKITAYRFQNQIVYFINPGFCFPDQAYDIISSDCNVIGRFGGFPGNTIINGEDFAKNAKELNTVWKR